MSQIERMSQLIPQLDYSLPDSPVSVVESRELLQVSNAGNAQLGPNQSTQFIISSSDRVLDGASVWFSLEMKTDVLNAQPKAITDIFKSVEVLMGGQRIELCDDVALLETVMRRVLYSNNYRKFDNQPGLVYDDSRLNVSPGTVVDGDPAPADAVAALTANNGGVGGTDTARGAKVRAMFNGYTRFAFKLNSIGSLGSGKFLPLLYSNGLELRFTLHNTNQAMSSVTGTPANSNFSVRNFKMHYSTIKLTKQASSMLSEYHRSGQLQLHIHSFAHSLKTSTGSFSHEIPSNKNVCTDVIHIQRASANLADHKEDSHRYIGYSSASFVESQLTYADNHRTPNKALQGSLEAYMHMRNSGPVQSVHSDTVSFEDFAGDFLPANQVSGLMIHSLETLAEADLNGLSTKNGRKLVIDYNDTSNTQVQNDFYIGYESVITLQADGSVSVED